MFTQDHSVSMVTAVLPSASVGPVSDAVLREEGSSALAWQARGTLLHEHWLKKWLTHFSY